MSEFERIAEQIIASEAHPERLIRSKIALEQPPIGTNMARELLGAFRSNSDTVLLVDTPSRREWTGAQLLDACGRIATGLIKQLQVKPNDIVMTICEHTGMEILAALGAVFAGAALFGTSPQDGYSEMKILCELAAPNVIIASSKQHEVAVALRKNLATLRDVKIVWLDNPMKHCDSGIVATSDLDENNYSTNDANNNNNNNELEALDLNNNNNADNIELIIERDQVVLFDDLMNGPLDEQLIESIAWQRIQAKEHILTYMLTSGSTGRPKVVPSTHEELVYGLYSMISATRQQINGCRLLHLGPEAIVSGDLPLDHGAGLNTMFLALYLGAKYVVMPSYDEDSFWQGVNDYKITSSISSTTFGHKLFARLKRLIDSNETDKWDLSSLECISCAGAKLASIELVREVQRVYKHMRVSQTYGCTEIGFISIVPANESLDDSHLRSTGYLMPGLLAKVVEQPEPGQVVDVVCNNGNEQQPMISNVVVGPGEQGELYVWALSKFKGYRCHVNDDSELIFANCHDERKLFYRTGDKAHCDPDGRIHIHGRFKDTLHLMEDWKILPAELEEVVNEHPLVEQSAVVGIDDPELPGCHKPKAFCKLISMDSVEFEQLAAEAAAASAATTTTTTRPDGDNSSQQQRLELSSRLMRGDFEYIRKHIYTFVAKRTAQPKHLTGGVRILDEFPRVGLLNKVDRKALLKMD